MSIDSIDVLEAYERLRRGEVFCIDVREAPEYQSGHLEGAALKPLSEHSWDGLPIKPCLVYCRKGIRSQKACLELSQLYPDQDFYSMQGGLEAWLQADLPLQSTQG